MKKIIGLFIVLILMSCSTIKSSQELNETSWEMKQLVVNGQEKELPSEKPILLFSEDNVLNGTTGCNSFFGKYDISENKVTFQIDGITKAFCFDSQEVEDVLLNQDMMNGMQFSIQKDKLVIENEVQKLRIEFARK